MTPHFDPEKAHFHDRLVFKPLYVKKTTPLAKALEQNKVRAETELLLLDHPESPIALIKDRMAYHHVAQGKIAGDPWLVSF